MTNNSINPHLLEVSQIPGSQVLGSFRADNQNVTLNSSPDTVEISTSDKNKRLKTVDTSFQPSPQKKESKKKEGLSKGAKWGIGIGTVILTGIATLGAIAIAIIKHDNKMVTKLYKEKMIFQNLAEKIDFKEAKTVEEGIKFAKEILKIGEVGEGFTLEAINFVNRGIVKVSNANKGKLFIPRKILYTEMKDNMLANVDANIRDNNFGYLSINKKRFDPNWVDKELEETLITHGFIEKTVEKAVEKTKEQTQDVVSKKTTLEFNGIYDDKIENLIERFKNNKASITLEQKRDLLHSIKYGDESLKQSLQSPMTSLRLHMKLLEKRGIKFDSKEFAKLSIEEQWKKLKEYLLKAREKGPLEFEVFYISADEAIYHEMGHLQDFAKNLKKLHLEELKLPSFMEIFHNKIAGRKILNTQIRQIENRWGGLTYEECRETAIKETKKFKEYYPDLYEFLTNKETQQTAGIVSWYAQTSIGEFIAETYAKMIRGCELPDAVMALYKKYNGPMLAA